MPRRPVRRRLASTEDRATQRRRCRRCGARRAMSCAAPSECFLVGMATRPTSASAASRRSFRPPGGRRASSSSTRPARRRASTAGQSATSTAVTSSSRRLLPVRGACAAATPATRTRRPLSAHTASRDRPLPTVITSLFLWFHSLVVNVTLMKTLTDYSRILV